ncbi:hypothetical protein AB0E08_30065 [Streptomyces sp. NPDC048281]|uniref:hypothetical protein n=1 Tax=Streptomyces sp. NPDC048281 TaxID=3154715 RepID=UPI0034420CBC
MDRHPEARRELAAYPSLIPNAIEQILRHILLGQPLVQEDADLFHGLGADC